MKRAAPAVPLLLLSPCAAQPWWWPPTGGLDVDPPCPPEWTTVELTLSGQWPDNCRPNAGDVVRNGSVIDLNIRREPPPGICLTVITPWSLTLYAGVLPVGEYQVFATYYLNGVPNTAREPMGTFEVDPACGPCYANCDGSTSPPVLNVQDFSCFLTRYAAAESYANCDGDSAPPVLNVQDFSCFLLKYAAGCP